MPPLNQRRLVPFHRAAFRLDAGDLVQFRPRPWSPDPRSWWPALVGALITWFGRGEHCHSGKLVAVRGVWFVAEMVEGVGGRLWPLAAYAQTHSGLIDVYRPRAEGYNAGEGVDAMLAFVGRPYGWRAILCAFALHLPGVRHAARKWAAQPGRNLPPFCSAAVAHADERGGGVDPVPELATEHTEPSDLTRSGLYGPNYLLTISGGAGCDPAAGAPLGGSRRGRGLRPRSGRWVRSGRRLVRLARRLGRRLRPLCLLPSALCLLTAAPAAAVEWDWTQPRPHHAAAVMVRVPSGNGESSGSGVYMVVGGRPGVLTAAHVVRGGDRCRLRWPSGEWTKAGRATTDKTGADLAWIDLPEAPRGVRPLPLCDRVPSVGETLEACGYGAGRGTLRHYRIELRPKKYDGMSSARPGPVEGDSGGAVLARDSSGRPAVVSVVTNGDDEPELYGDSKAYDRMLFPDQGVVRAFLGRVAEREAQCGPGGCPPGGPAPGGLFPPKEIYVGPQRGRDYEPRQDPYRELTPIPRSDPVGPDAAPGSVDGRLHSIADKLSRVYDKFHRLYVWIERVSTVAGIVGGVAGAGGVGAWMASRSRKRVASARQRFSGLRDRFGDEDGDDEPRRQPAPRGATRRREAPRYDDPDGI